MVGEVLRVSDREVLVAGRRGDVVVAWRQVVACRRVPPPPLPEPHRRVDVEEMTRVASRGWPAVRTEPLGDWQLRWSDGFTRRGSSVLAVGGPGTGHGAALDAVVDWYAALGRPALVQLADSPLADVLAPDLAARGFVPAHETLLMTAPSATVAVEDDRVVWADVLEPVWERAYARQRPGAPEAARQVLGAAGASFARVEEDGRVVAVGRLTVDGGWGGLSCIWVDPALRRRGLATSLTRALAARARREGAGSLYLQVEADNAAALVLYQRLGFTEHHRYRYWEQSQAAS
ncbi:Acetyltransferase (GNAT) family protein [Auraticoccus monumenti]|uniref:Acetyltransferase (GNAT) family protein n=1 Tax=Auraticoccus monumenti TaxID=675864 RepID=A0A1G7E7G7_9ACTN|nr:GNAT family N-acetyltransferase [Auraticoccus monumenti]SDE59549.1 Acetyltransferase (GNAT) family protein [Auraticoccus monumenti]